MSLNEDIKNMVESLDLVLYDIVTTNENADTIFRVSVLDEGGVSLDKCAQLTHLISPLLDVTPPVSGDYRLEVSSPGIERLLKTQNHFLKSIGDKIKVTLIDKRKLQGEILSVKGNTITLKTEETEENIELSEINKAKTYFEW
ncbi:MAG: ribosome maturation factor RimP [Helicobacteraceae bacterium]|nr:ribosome maturation factor RimP [Helicobacteraceae bacterium]